MIQAKSVYLKFNTARAHQQNIKTSRILKGFNQYRMQFQQLTEGFHLYILYDILVSIYGGAMGKPLMIQIEDDSRIEKLKAKLGAKSKVDVVRAALSLLEDSVSKADRIKRWEKAARVVGKSGLNVLKEFQTPKRFAKLP
jgi:hypothetical protein